MICLKSKFQTFNSNQGVALYLALIIMTILLAIGLGISIIIIGQLKMAGGMGNSIIALSAADSGIEKILYENKLCQVPGCSPPCRAGCLGLGAGEYLETLSNYSSYDVKVSGPFTFSSRGTFKEDSRAIEIFIPYYKRVFVTSQSFTGNLRSACVTLLSENSCQCGALFVPTCPFPSLFCPFPYSADRICQCLAYRAGLPGDYKAWLSSDDDVSSPLGRFTHSTIPYRRLDVKLIADDWNDLVSGVLENPINIDEQGNINIIDAVWTNTNTDGTFYSSAKNCTSWTNGGTSYVGQSTQDPGYPDWWTIWGTAGAVSCALEYRLYCFQQ